MQKGNAARNTSSPRALHGLAGAGMGALISVLPFSAGYASAPSTAQYGLIGLVVGACAFLGWRWGERFLDSVSRALDSTST